MSDLDTVEFNIHLDSIYHDRPPMFEVLVDDTVQGYGTIEGPMNVKFSVDLPEGEHILKIRLDGKKDSDVILDNDGNILKDQLLKITEIEIDEIELGHLAWQLSRFYPKPRTDNANPEPVDNMLDIGWNGEWQLKFQSPTYIWFLENF
jgi:hypothetical protein